MERKINCLVIDDEYPAIQLMQKYIVQMPHLQLTEVFKSSVKAKEFIDKNKVDLLFCDIQMSELTGIDLIKSISYKPMVVFTTAFSEFAAEAFDLDAIDYLKKPFSFDRFSKAAEKALENFYIRQNPPVQFEKAENDYIIVKADQRMVKVFFEEILFVEAFQEYVKIITNTSRYITFERMKNMESLLPANQFLRVHRSYIVACGKVKSMSGNMLEVFGHQIPVSRDLREKVQQRLF